MSQTSTGHFPFCTGHLLLAPRMVVTKINGTRRACLLLLCRIPSTILLCPLARRRLTENSTRECPEMGRNAADLEALGAPGDPSCWNPDGGPLGVLPVTSQDPDVGQGRLSPGKNESPARAPGKHISCPQLFQERSFLLIFCTISFFTFKHTFIRSCRRRPCSVMETEKGFLGHLSPHLKTFCLQQTGKEVGF